MRRYLYPCACLLAVAAGFTGSALLQRAPDTSKRMDAALGRVFVVDNVEYVSARIYHVSDHIICVGQGGKELVLHVAAIENITKHTHLNQEAIK